MAEAACACLPLIFSGVKLTIDLIVDLELKFRQNDLSVTKDIMELMENMHKYSKKDKKKIWEYIMRMAKMNASYIDTVKNSVVDNRSIDDDEKEHLPEFVK